MNSDGTLEFKPLSYILDVEAFVKRIIEERNIKDPLVVLGADYGKSRHDHIDQSEHSITCYKTVLTNQNTELHIN